MENRSLNIIVLMAVALGALGASAQGGCGDCLVNGIACVNETSFQMCFGPNPDESQTMVCPAGEVCTGLKTICVRATDMAPVCEATVGCGKCATLGGFTCLSKTTFALCVGGEVTPVGGKCPEGSICDAGSASTGVCVDQCGGTPTCKLDDPK